jgi:hypothetical protein
VSSGNPTGAEASQRSCTCIPSRRTRPQTRPSARYFEALLDDGAPAARGEQRSGGRLGTREDIALHQQYMADIAASSREALDTVDPTPYFVKYGENTWAAVRGYLDAVTAAAATP